MKTITSSYSTTTEIKRSKFITHLVPCDSYEGLQEQLKREHPKANHVVYALRYLNSFDQVVENSSDDGEPKGCAGVPALNVLRGEELVNVAVLIVRYFGGIKLGTGGMARAYAQAVKDVLEAAALVPYEKPASYTFETDYSSVESVMYRLRKIGIERVERDFDVACVRWRIEASESQVEQFKALNR